MSDRFLKVDRSLCTGCGICELWCSLWHPGRIQPSGSRIRILRDHHTRSNVPQVCLQCRDRYCIAACPPKIRALRLDEHSAAVLVDMEKCIGCAKCAEACPYDGIHLLAEERKVSLCVLCAGDPQCVRHCPEGALSYTYEG